MQRNLVRGVATVLALVCLIVTGAPAAHSDDLDDRRADLDRALAAADSAIDDASAQVNSAVAAVEAARRELAGAERDLARAEAATARARELAEKRQRELEEAERDVARAEADVAAAQAALDSTEARINEEITVITQQSGPLVDLALLLTDVDMSNLNQRAQLSETLFTSSAIQLDELQSRRFILDAAKVAADEARTRAEAARQSAREQLSLAEDAQAEADRMRDQVAARKRARDAALDAAQVELAKEEKRQAELEAESRVVDKRIAERIAAEEARRAKEEADRKAEAARKAAAEKQQANASQGSGGSSTSRPSTRFLRPVNGPITSSYGMRLHPVLGYWKLHDGTDFGAACGTPIRAAEDGVVAERYYNTGYGNRLMIDHGRYDGKYITTGYNHASRYVVGVGQRVSRGQLIGYVGNTGYSTGCHLHLMVWENGNGVDPMAKWFR